MARDGRILVTVYATLAVADYRTVLLNSFSWKYQYLFIYFSAIHSAFV